MRRIIEPEANAAAVEDLEIRYFDFDEKGNVAVKTSIVEVPTGFGRFAQAAMLKGFLEFFDKAMPGFEVNDPKRQLMVNAIEKSLGIYRQVLVDVQSRGVAQEPKGDSKE